MVKRLQEILRIRFRSEGELVTLVEYGLPTQTIEGLRRFGLTENDIFQFVMSKTAFANRRSRHQNLTAQESDRVVRVARIITLAESVFGHSGPALDWLRMPKRQFSGRSPLQLMKTEAGGRLVKEFLYRIDEGIAA